MAGFDITPADPLGTAQDFRQTMAKTAVLEQQAQQAPLITAKMIRADTADQQALADNNAFRAKLQSLDPALGLTKQLDAIGTAAFQTGKFDEGNKVITMMTQLEGKAGLQAVRQARELDYKMKAQGAQLKAAATLYAGVTDPITKELADQRFQETFGTPSPIAGKPYSKELITYATGAITKQVGAIEQQKVDALAKWRKTLEGIAATNAELRRRGLDIRQEAVDNQIERTAKMGGKAAVASRAEITLADDAIREAYPEMKLADRAGIARQLANEAKMQRLGDPSVDFKDLVQTAVSDNPDLFKVEPTALSRATGGMLGGRKVVPGVVGQPLPTDRTKLVTGNVYKTARGNARYVGGGKFEAVEAGK